MASPNNYTDKELGGFLADKMDEFMHIIASHLMQDLMKDDLSMNQFGILKELFTNGDVPMNRLADTLHVTAPAITTIVDKLEREDYVKRIRDDADRRIVNVMLTKKGREVIQRHKDARLRLLSLILSKMTPNEKKQWAEIYERISVIFSALPADAKVFQE